MSGRHTHQTPPTLTASTDRWMLIKGVSTSLLPSSFHHTRRPLIRHSEPSISPTIPILR